MTNKTLFWLFYVSFCTFCASLRLIKHLFSQPKTSIISVNPVILSNFSSCLRVLRGEKIREISVNPWLINDLRSTKVYVRNYKLFMQNKANFRKVKLNVTDLLTVDYENKTLGKRGKTKPIQSQSKPIKANSNPIKAKTNPIQTQTNPISKIFLTPFSSIPPQSGQSVQSRQPNPAAINKNLPKYPNLNIFIFDAC